MSRAKTSTPYAKRNSRTAGKTSHSQFAGKSQAARVAAAEVAVNRLRRELVALRDLAAQAENSFERRRYSMRVTSVKARIVSWEDYLARQAPVVPGAVMAH